MKNNEKQDNDLLSLQAKAILEKPYARKLIPDESGGYVASIQEFPGCIAEGDTADESLQNLDNASLAWIMSALSTGYPVRDPICFDGYSGKIALRIPRGLHKQLAELAELEDTSINQILVSAISQYVGEKRFSAEMFEEIKKVMAPKLIEPKVIVIAMGNNVSKIPSFNTAPITGFLEKSVSAP